MSLMSVSIESPEASSPTRLKPRLLLRGRMRKQVQKLLAAAESVLAADFKEQARADRLGYTPYLFVGTINSTMNKKMNEVINNCYAMMHERS